MLGFFDKFTRNYWISTTNYIYCSFSDFNNYQVFMSLSEMFSLLLEGFGKHQSRLNGLPTMAVLSSIPELVQTPSQGRDPSHPLSTPPPDTREEPPPMLLDQPSSPEAPQQGKAIHRALFHERSGLPERAHKVVVY